MNDAKYIGLDMHQATICAAVLDSAGNLVMEAILETKTETILQFLGGIRGSLRVTLEEGTWAAWLHDLLKPHVTRVVVCDTRKTGLGKNQNRNDRRRTRTGAAFDRKSGRWSHREVSRWRKTPCESLSSH